MFACIHHIVEFEEQIFEMNGGGNGVKLNPINKGTCVIGAFGAGEIVTNTADNFENFGTHPEKVFGDYFFRHHVK
jgi:hypothetical protein